MTQGRKLQEEPGRTFPCQAQGSMPMWGNYQRQEGTSPFEGTHPASTRGREQSLLAARPSVATTFEGSCLNRG